MCTRADADGYPDGSRHGTTTAMAAAEEIQVDVATINDPNYTTSRDVTEFGTPDSPGNGGVRGGSPPVADPRRLPSRCAIVVLIGEVGHAADGW